MPKTDTRVPTPMHPTACNKCGTGILHTAALWVRLCWRCRVALGETA